MGIEIERTQSAVDPAMTIGDILDAGVRTAPDQEIVYADKRRMTYRDLRERVHRLAGALSELGIQPGDTVAVMDWDTHRYLEAFFAIPMMGAVLHTINVRLSPEQMLYTINHAEDKVILVNREFLSALDEIRDRIESVDQYVLLDDGEGPEDTGVSMAGEYEALLARADPGFAFPELAEDTRATTFYTTGTTGLPKGVYFSHRQLVLHTLAGRQAMSGTGHGRFNQNDVYMPITPMFHVHAWGVPYMATMMGVKQVYPGRYEPQTLLKLLVGEKVTFSHCVPTIIQMLLQSEAAKDVDVSGWKVIIGGSALAKPLCRQALERGIDVYTGYGMSETCPLMTLSHMPAEAENADLDTQVDYRTRAGRPVPLMQLRVVDENMNDRPHDGESQGEVVARGPWLTQGYLKDPENSERLWQGRWLHTGDIGVIDPEGYLRITDRIKDVIKTGGEWVSSLELESMILRHDAVAECAVIGMPDSQWGERPMALVVQSGEVTEDEIKDMLREDVKRGFISKYGVPDQVRFVESLPRTSVGKLDKKNMRTQYAE
jgi:fatty-acyl-CoA synthase